MRDASRLGFSCFSPVGTAYGIFSLELHIFLLVQLQVEIRSYRTGLELRDGEDDESSVVC